MAKVITCPKCNSANTKALYKHPSGRDAYTCNDCQHNFLDFITEKLTIAEQIEALKNPPIASGECDSEEIPDFNISTHKPATKLPRCPNCHASETEANRGPSNGIIGPGFVPGAIINYTCQACGVVFNPVKSQQ